MNKITVVEFETLSGKRVWIQGDDLSHCIAKMKEIEPEEMLTVRTMEVF
jgi:hypothetical protein